VPDLGTDQNISHNRLKAAVHSVEPPAFLEARIRRTLREQEQPSSGWFHLLGWGGLAAAAAMIVLGVAALYHQGYLRLTRSSQLAYVDQLVGQVGSLMGVGLVDHMECAVYRKYPKDPPTRVYMQKVLEEYKGLLPIVREKVPQEYQLSLGHQCTFRRRKYVHLSFRNESKTISLMVTRKRDPGESFDAAHMEPFLREAGLPIYQASAQRYQLTAFETQGYLVYFISDLSQEQNTSLMASLAPEVKTYLERL
jgi:hypothetical protein